MKNNLYSCEIGERIKEILADELPNDNDIYKNIIVGDLSVLPHPDYLSQEVPVIIISMESVDITPANKALGVYHQCYNFSIFYVYAIDLESGNDYIKEAKTNAEMVANVLLEYVTLGNFSVSPTDLEAGGLVTDSDVTRISFDVAENEFFRSLSIPAAIGVLNHKVDFRTYERGK